MERVTLRTMILSNNNVVIANALQCCYWILHYYPDHSGDRWLWPHNQILGGRHWCLHTHPSTSRLSGWWRFIQSNPFNDLGSIQSYLQTSNCNDLGELFRSSTWWKYVGCRRLSAHKVWVNKIVTKKGDGRRFSRYPNESSVFPRMYGIHLH